MFSTSSIYTMATNNPIKPQEPRPKSGVTSIGTHDGKFHADEVLSCFMLKTLPEYSAAQIIRTRDETLLKICDVVVDVGGVFDPVTKRFDHHQKSFHETMSSVKPGKKWITKLSSAGLIYAFYGEAVIASILGKEPTDEDVQILYDKMYEYFIEAIDAVDNGINVNDQPMKYRVTTDLSSRVSYLNPSWKEGNVDELGAFQVAMKMVGEEFTQRVHYYAENWLESFTTVKKAIEARFELDKSGEIIEMPTYGVSWKDHLATLEKELDVEVPIKYVIFLGKDEVWRIQAVPISPDSFATRAPLKEEWRGLLDKELEEICGIPTARFVHATGFIGSAVEKDAVLQMARLTLQT